MASLSDALVRHLLEGRYIASFATQNPNGSIHMVANWYWFDGADIFVATSSRSRKARNLQGSTQASLMIDSREPSHPSELPSRALLRYLRARHHGNAMRRSIAST